MGIVVSANEATTIIASNTAANIVATNPNAVILASGSQGPQGIRGLQGVPGPAGGSVFQLIAGADLGGDRVITGAAAYADATDLDTVGRAIGVTEGASSLGDPVNVVALGELDGFFGLTIDEPVYLSVNGTVTQTLPTTGYLQKIGLAISSTKIFISIDSPFILTA